MKKNLLVEIVGWAGMSAVLIAYGLLSFSLIDAGNIWYQIMNLAGALGVLAVSVYKKVYQPAALNAVWAIIALVAIIQIFV